MCAQLRISEQAETAAHPYGIPRNQQHLSAMNSFFLISHSRSTTGAAGAGAESCVFC